MPKKRCCEILTYMQNPITRLMRTSSQDVGIDVVRFFTEKMSEWISSGFSAEKSRKRTKPELRQVIDLSKGTMRAKE